MELISFIAAVAVTVGVANSNFPVYPFDINNQLICHVENPLKNVEGQPDVIPENIPRLPFAQRVRQGNFDNEIWLPANLTYRIPPGVPNRDLLLRYLGSDFNSVVTSTFRPARTAPLACVVGGGTEGSGGVPTRHFPTNTTPTPTLSLASSEDNATFLEVSNLIMGDPAKLNNVTTNYCPERIETARDILLMEINVAPELCEIWTALCPLTTVWAELPLGYFPPFIAQGTCSGKNCSFPRGKHCEEDFSYVSYATVLRWDCCYNREQSQVRWDCGWRKVQVPFVCDCTCACSEVFHTLRN